MSEQQSVEKFWDMIGDFDTCMVTTRDGDKLRARPMAPRVSKARDKILFITDRDSHKVDEVEADNRVSCTFTKHGEYVAVSGTASISGDRALVDEIWDAEVEAWMPQGKDDPSVAVFVIDPNQAEIWDVTTNKVKQAYEFAKAYVGDKPQPDTTDNRKIDL